MMTDGKIDGRLTEDPPKYDVAEEPTEIPNEKPAEQPNEKIDGETELNPNDVATEIPTEHPTYKTERENHG